jgi:hypothetical protein
MTFSGLNFPFLQIMNSLPKVHPYSGQNVLPATVKEYSEIIQTPFVVESLHLDFSLPLLHFNHFSETSPEFTVSQTSFFQSCCQKMKTELILLIPSHKLFYGQPLLSSDHSQPRSLYFNEEDLFERNLYLNNNTNSSSGQALIIDRMIEIILSEIPALNQPTSLAEDGNEIQDVYSSWNRFCRLLLTSFSHLTSLELDHCVLLDEKNRQQLTPFSQFVNSTDNVNNIIANIDSNGDIGDTTEDFEMAAQVLYYSLETYLQIIFIMVCLHFHLQQLPSGPTEERPLVVLVPELKPFLRIIPHMQENYFDRLTQLKRIVLIQSTVQQSENQFSFSFNQIWNLL